MSTSKTYQQSLADAGSETRHPILERGSYIPWASRFRRYINRKRENQKWLNKALNEGPYQFQMFIPIGSTLPTLQTVEDLQCDELLHYDAEIELMNLILLSIPNEIYKSFVVEPGEALVSVYNRFAQLMNDLEQNKMIFPIVTVNTKFLNSLQLEWLKYVTHVCLVKRLTVDSFDDLFNYLQQFEKLVNASRAKKIEKSHDPLALVAYTGSSSRNTSSYYVSHLTSMVDYDKYQQDDVQINFEDPLASAMLLLARAITQNFSNPTNNHLRTSSNTRNQAIIQGDRVNMQSRNSGNTGRNTRRAYVQEEVVKGSNAQNETGNVQRTLQTSSSGNNSTVQCYNYSGKGHYARNYPKPRVHDSKYFMEQMLLAKQDEVGVILTDEQNDFLFADASRMEEIEEPSANICLITRSQPADNTSDAGPSYDSAFISEVQSSSIKYNQEQMYPTHTKIINSTISDDQIDSNIIFDEPNGNVNSGSVEKDTHVPDLYALEQLARNAYKEAEKQQLFSQKVQQQNTTLTNIIRDLEKQRDKLDLAVTDYKRKNEELQKTHLILKRQMSENEDRYHDTILDLEAKLKKNVDLILKLGHSDDASKSQQKMKEKTNDPIVVANKQNCWTIDYKQINALYKDFVPQKELSAEQKYFPSSFIPSDKTPNATSSVPASMPSESPLIIQLDKMKSCFQTLSELIQKNCKRASIFYTSPEEIQLNDFCQDQVKPIVNELQFYFEFFRKLFQRDIKEMKDVFESTESELCEIKKQNDFLKDQLLEASLRHEVEISVLLNHECVDNSLHAEIEQIKKNSIEIQEGLQAKIKILEKDVQRCQKQSVDFELKLQHEKEKHKWESTLNNKNTNPLDYSWISKMEKLENENVSLEFQVQSLIKERDNVKLEYQKLFDSIKKTRSQSQKEMDELIEHVSEKTYAYGVIRAENQNLLSTISKLKTRVESVEKGMNAASSVRRPMNRDSHVKNSVLANSKNSAKKVAVYVRKNKQTDNTSANVIPNKENVNDINVANADKAKTLLCVSCMKNVLIPCHDKCLAKYKLNVHSNVRRALSTNSRTPKSSDTTYVVLKTRFSEKLTQSKSLDTTSVVSKPKIDEGSALKAKHKVSSASKTKKRNLRDYSLSIYMKNKIRTSQIWQKWFESQPNVVWSPVNTTLNVHNSHSSEKPSGSPDRSHSQARAIIYMAISLFIMYIMLKVLDIISLALGHESNLYTISISDMAASSPVFLMSKATLTKSWLWHRRLSHLNFGTINDLTRLDLVDGLPKFKYRKDHLCFACKRGKARKLLIHPNWFQVITPSDYSRCTWVYFLHLKDETPEIIKKFITQAQLNYKAKVCKIRTDNGTEFKNATLKAHCEKLGIIQQFSTARTPQQNGVVERRNRTLVEAARTMLIFSRLLKFIWAEVVATACFTQN
ncbi:retrovirus-related pol polyprotein from transposon TNT 1-94 [Tanacetum coccineum]